MIKNVFHAKSSFGSWNIYFFVLTFCYVEKRLDKKVSKFLTSQTAHQIIKIHILPNMRVDP